LKKKKKFVPKVFDLNELNFNKRLDNLVRRIIAYEKYENWKKSVLEELNEPNELDDELIETIDDTKELANFKKALEFHFRILSKNDFYSHLSSHSFNLVLFYSPCETFSYFKFQ
jgi:hypothetical protein